MEIPEGFLDFDENRNSLKAKCELLLNGQRVEFLDKCLAVLEEENLPELDLDKIIEGVIWDSLQERNRKLTAKHYYKYSLLAFCSILSDEFLQDLIEEFSRPFSDDLSRDLLAYNYYGLLFNLLFDAVHLMEGYETYVLKTDIERTVWRSSFQPDFTLYQYLSQVLYGQVSIHSFIDREANVSISIIRQMLELRIRNAFTIYGLIDSNNHAITQTVPIAKIFEILKRHQEKIDFTVPLHNVERIYKWANYFVHAGLKDDSWKPIVVQRYLHPLMTGREIPGQGSGVYYGIGFKRELLDIIHNEILEGIAGKEILTFGRNPAAIIL
ncbi:MAG: hypothetical protein C4523_11850 [Myxococcales bacterium]|nr:MAG: hypothetical protein C4523_11850 [Myxococcales bacterium]